MKDYLNSSESLQLIASLKIIEISKDFINGNLMTKEEKTNLKKAMTWLDKSIDSVTTRLNEKARKAFEKSKTGTAFYLGATTEIEVYRKRRSTDIDTAYEENKEYFRLIELIMHYNCQNCQKDCHECLIYNEFEENYIPEFIGKELNCKYAYRSDCIENAKRGNGQGGGEHKRPTTNSEAKTNNSKEDRKQKGASSKIKK